MGGNVGFAAGCNAGAGAAQRRPAGHPQPRRGAAARLRRGDPPALAGGPRLGRLAGAGRRRRGAPRSTRPATRPLHRHRLGRRPRRADRRGAGGRRGDRRSPAPAWRSRCGTWREVGGFPERFFLYHEDVDLSMRLRLRGGTRSGSSRPPWSTTTTSSAPREHKWRWLERNRLAFLVRVYPAPLLAPAGAGAARDRAGAARRLGRRRLGAAEAARRTSTSLRWLPRLLRERRPDPGAAHGQRRRVRLLADPGPRLALHPAARPLAAGAPASCAPTGAGPLLLP